MNRTYCAPIPQATATRDSLAALVPVLKTERLTLRAPMAEDWDVLEPIWRTNRGQFIGGPFNEEDAWLDFSQATAGWILRGLGYWTVTRRSDGQVLGLVGIAQEIYDPELELGWMFVQEAEGHGYAFEAATAARAYAFETLGIKTLLSFVHRDNHRSLAVANRLGARPDDTVLPGVLAAEDVAFRHISEPTQYRRNTDAIPTGESNP